jgi:hypothetical protein
MSVFYGYTQEELAAMSDEQCEVFADYGIKLPAAEQGNADDTADGADGVTATGDADTSDDGDDGADTADNADDADDASDTGDSAGSVDDTADTTDDGADDNGYAELQRKERNGELTKRETRKLTALRKQMRDEDERRALQSKIVGLEQKIADWQSNIVAQTGKVIDDAFRKFGLADGELPDGQGRAGAMPAGQTGGAADTIEARLGQMERMIAARDQRARAETAERERARDVQLLSEIAPGIKSTQDILNLDKLPQMLQFMDMQIAAGLPRDIRAAYALAYNDEIIEREVQRQVKAKTKLDDADVLSRKSVSTGHMKGLPPPVERKAMTASDMKRVAGLYGIPADKVQDVYKDYM